MVTFGLLAASLWLLYAGTQVFGLLDFSRTSTVGTGTVSGIVGLAVILVALGMLVFLFGELGESEPGPETWPPSE